MQLRLNDVIVNDTPKFLTEKPTEQSHALIIPSNDPDDPDNKLLIPLSIQGVTSTFPTRKPTAEEYETCPCYELTYETPEYEPNDPRYAQQEAAAAASTDPLLETGDQEYDSTSSVFSFQEPRGCKACC